MSNATVPVSAALDLQAAMVTAAKADAVLTAQLKGGFLDAVPENRVFPYVNFGEELETDDGSDGIDASASFLDLHIWSRAAGETGRVEVKRIAARLRAVFDFADFDLAHSALVSLKWESLRILRDPDGLTWHGIVTFRALTEEA